MYFPQLPKENGQSTSNPHDPHYVINMWPKNACQECGNVRGLGTCLMIMYIAHAAPFGNWGKIWGFMASSFIGDLQILSVWNHRFYHFDPMSTLKWVLWIIMGILHSSSVTKRSNMSYIYLPQTSSNTQHTITLLTGIFRRRFKKFSVTYWVHEGGHKGYFF